MSGYDTYEQWIERQTGGQGLVDDGGAPPDDPPDISIYDLDMHEQTNTGCFTVLRVPGGWIYYARSVWIPCFVPYKPIGNCSTPIR